MSRTRHSGKGGGYEYWASRSGKYYEVPGRYIKVITHLKERRVGKLEVVRTPDEVRKYAAGGM